jgi:membrane associated rhomboid family serine protease
MRITISLMVINAIVFVLQQIFYPSLDTVFALTPAVAVNSLQLWQFVTYMFLHGGLMHITFNMFTLFMFGTVIEHSLGEKKYIILYIVSGIGAALFYVLLMGLSDVMMLGASGAVFGILTAYGFMFPKNIIFVFPGIPLPAFFAVIGFAVLELVAGILNLEPGIANFGHLGGIVTGVILMLYWKRNAKKNKREFEYFWQ